MSAEASAVTAAYRWHDGSLHAIDYCDPGSVEVLVADSWLVEEGSTLAIALHRDRFLGSIRRIQPARDADTGSSADIAGPTELDAFWTSVIAAIPRTGSWFPRVELQRYREAWRLVYRQRSSPLRTRSVRLCTHLGRDPRTDPTTKGPDLARLAVARTAAQARGAQEAVILDERGFVVDGCYSAIMWWRGDRLYVPSPELDRVGSVTAASVLGVAAALGVDVEWELATPRDLAGLEVWSVNALHGIRIATSWIDGPELAEQPGRLESWRRRLGKLARPIDSV